MPKMTKKKLTKINNSTKSTGLNKLTKLTKSNITVKKNVDNELIESANNVLNDASTAITDKNIISAKTLFNLPNSLTILRMILAPFFMWAILISDYMAALVIIAVASISDFFDGFLARKLDMQTEIGGILDPVADKVLIFCSIVALLIKFNFPLWIAVIIVSRDVILLIGGAIFFYNKKQAALAPNMFGKVSTFFQMITIIIYIIAAVNGYYAFWIDILLYITVITTLISGITYVFRIGKVFASAVKK